MRGESCKHFSVVHVDVVRFAYPYYLQTVPMTPVLGAGPNLPSLHTYERHPTKQKVGPGPPRGRRQVLHEAAFDGLPVHGHCL